MDKIITIDGPAGSGKSSISRLVAKKINFLYLDTGAMYRAVALAATRRGINLSDGRRMGDLCKTLDLRFDVDKDGLFSGNEDVSDAIRSPEIDMAASTVSTVKEVRSAMLDLQQKMARGLNIVAEGRDMGTVVFSGAEHKFFLTASVEERAKRRYRERIKRGESVSRNSVREDLEKRDLQDESRALAPLRPAEDAIIIDSTGLSIKQVVEKIFNALNSHKM